jgi:hypothetical protein
LKFPVIASGPLHRIVANLGENLSAWVIAADFQAHDQAALQRSGIGKSTDAQFDRVVRSVFDLVDTTKDVTGLEVALRQLAFVEASSGYGSFVDSERKEPQCQTLKGVGAEILHIAAKKEG